MKYLICILCPPLAVLMTARPFSAALNFLLTLCLWVPGVVHAMIVVNADRVEERHAETLAAIIGRPVVKKRSEEISIFYACLAVGGALFAVVMICALVAAHNRGVDTRAAKHNAATLTHERQSVTIDPTAERLTRLQESRKEMEGMSYADMVALHGEPETKDAATGWAIWKDFKALFKTGKVAEVQIYE
ncbi:MAG: YqaE/Pmp3 family membrane protein [Prosthecobacter sp.]